MVYRLTGRDTYQVEFTTKPDEYLEYLKRNAVDEKSPYRKGIPVVADVTIEMSAEEDLNTVPKCIMSHAVKDINVAIAAILRPMAGEGSFEKRYDTLKSKLLKPIEYTATIEAAKKGAREKVSPMAKVMDRLLKAYGVEKLHMHLLKIAEDMQAEDADADKIVLKWATIMEKEAQKKQK